MQLTIDFEDYRPWSGAVDTFNTIRDEDKLDSLENLLDEIYPDGMTTTELNDLLWFDSEWVLENLGIVEDEEDEEE